MEIKPLKKKVLIAENNTERKTESGIVLDGIKSMKETPIATVLAIGPEVTQVKVGDVILIVEAMKMEHGIKANKDGVIKQLYFNEGDQVQSGAILCEIQS